MATIHCKRLAIIIGCLVVVGCSGNPSGPTPVPTPAPAPIVTPPTPPPPSAAIVESAPCPTALPGFSVDVAFYRQIGCNAFDGPIQNTTRRWTRAPMIYLRTVDDAGAAIDSVTLETVAAAMINTASALTGGKFGLAGMERGTDSRAGLSGWITIRFPATLQQNACGFSDIAIDGGSITFSATRPDCGCKGSRIAPSIARHELGHALGYWHTDNASDLMSNVSAKSCDQSLSAREQQAIAYQYR